MNRRRLTGLCLIAALLLIPAVVHADVGNSFSGGSGYSGGGYSGGGYSGGSGLGGMFFFMGGGGGSILGAIIMILIIVAWAYFSKNTQNSRRQSTPYQGGVSHFGDAVDMTEVMEKIPSDVMALGNVSPAGEFRGGTPESIKQATWKVMEACCKYPNFVISSGCDIPPMSPWENIDAFFAAVDACYQK